MDISFSPHNIEALKVLFYTGYIQQAGKLCMHKAVLTTPVSNIIHDYQIKSRKIDKESRTYLAIIESNLNSIPSLLPLSSANYLQNLTITENQVADLIKQGKTSKEIATMLNVSTAAVSFHRNNIRKKLGLSNKKIRLAAHLISGGLKMPE